MKRCELQAIIASLSGELEEVKPECEHFGKCGGCALQNFLYESQLRIKAEGARRAFEEAGVDAEFGEPIEAVEK